MREALARAVRLTHSPNAEWLKVRRETPGTGALFLRFVIPLSAIPAVSWAIGLGLAGEGAAFGRNGAMNAALIAQHALVAFAGSVVSIAMLGFAIGLLAPMFGVRRELPRAFQVAAYGSAPMLLAGVILVIPGLAFALLLAALHSLYLVYGGVQLVIGVKEDEAAECVALVFVLYSIGLTLLGALGSLVGVV